MHLALSVLDQWLNGLSDKLAERAAAELRIKQDPVRLKSAAFVFLCVKTLLDVDDDEAFECVTEGGGDCGVDALHLRYLGLHGNRVNEAVRRSLQESPDDFYFYNNGLTLICSDFRMNGIQQVNHTVRASDVQIVNGGQTCMTVFKTLKEMAEEGKPFPETASVLIRLYKLPPEKSHLAANITRATNTQNPVDLQDLAANDTLQVQPEADMAELGYTYKRKREEGAAAASEISARAVTESVLAVLLRKPYLARSRSQHFGRLYQEIFASLNGAKAVTAVLLYRAALSRRKRPRDNDPDHTPYSSAFVAMRAGD